MKILFVRKEMLVKKKRKKKHSLRPKRREAPLDKPSKKRTRVLADEDELSFIDERTKEA